MAPGVHRRLHVIAGFDSAFLGGHHAGLRIGKQQRSAVAFSKFLQTLLMKRDPLLQLLRIRQMVLVQIQSHRLIQPFLMQVIFVQCLQISFYRLQLSLRVFQFLAGNFFTDRFFLSICRTDGCPIQAKRFRVHQLHIFAGADKNQKYLLQRFSVVFSEIGNRVVVRY